MNHKSFQKISILILFLTFLFGIIVGVGLQRCQIPGKVLNLISEHYGPSINKYDKPVDNKLINIFGEPAKIFRAERTYVYSTPPERNISKNFKHYRYYWHYEEIQNFLISDRVKNNCRKTHENFWVVDGTSCAEEFVQQMHFRREFLKRTIGVQDLPPNGKVNDKSIVFQDDTIAIVKAQLQSRIPSISVPLYIVKPRKHEIKGVVIAIHGYSGAPEKVVGLERPDYTRAFGGKLARKGYVCFAPYVLNVGDRNTNISALGMLYAGITNYGIDIQKLLSVVDYIKGTDELNSLPLVSYGMSYGGILSVMLAAIDDRIDIVVSSGCMQNTQRKNEKYFSLSNDVIRSNFVIFNRPYQIYFHYSDYAKLIYPRDFIIELGAYDLRPGSVEEFKKIKSVYRKFGLGGKCKLIWFRGYHETAPELTIKYLSNLVNQ